jgi:hypothetical protein
MNGALNSQYRRLPQVGEFVSRDQMQQLLDIYPEDLVIETSRRVIARLRSWVKQGAVTDAELQIAIEQLSESVAAELAKDRAQSLRSVINATGVILQTNLGRAPLSQAAIRRIRRGCRWILQSRIRFGVRGAGPAFRPLSRAKKAVTLAWLQQLTRADAPEQLRLRVLRHGKSGISTAELIAETGLTPDAIARMMQPLIVSGRVISAGSQPERFLSADALAAIADLVMGELERTAPAGLAKAELQSKTVSTRAYWSWQSVAWPRPAKWTLPRKA